MELFYVENTKYITKCPECLEIVGIKINYENFTLSVQCKDGHNKDELPFNEFEDKYIKPSQIYKCKCHYCFKLLNDDTINFKCLQCNKLLCSNCVNNHFKETKHNTEKFIQKYQLCEKHNQKYNFFCETCKQNICDKCKKSHRKHTIKSILNLIPTKTKLDSVNNSLEEFDKKVDELLSLMRKYKEEIDKRYTQINGFFQFLKNINNYLLNNFNSNYFDYYNFENFNYLFDSLKDDNIFDINKYKNYLFMKEKNIKENNEDNEDKIESTKEKRNEFKIHRRENEANINYIQNLNKLQYLKENIFFVFDKTFIKFFKFENYAFTSFLYYDLGKFKIYNIQPAKYSNSILINFEFKKNVKILEYDLINKTIKLSKKDIKEQKMGYPRHFYKCIDNNNGNILTQDNVGTTIWKLDEKKNYIKHSTINIAQLSLFNVSENLITFQDNNYNIYFYDTINYECNNKIYYDKKVNLIGIINNEIMIFNNSYSSVLFMIDIKYLEIIQIIDNNKYYPSIKIKDNYLLTFYMENDNKLIIKKNEYNIKEHNFKLTETIEKDSKLNSFSNVLITDFDYIVIVNYNTMTILNL